MNANEKNVDDLMNRLQNKHLNDDELEKISGGGMFAGLDPSQCPKGVSLDVDPKQCPKGLSKFIVYFDGSPSNIQCIGCVHNTKFANGFVCHIHLSRGSSEWVW